MHKKTAKQKYEVIHYRRTQYKLAPHNQFFQKKIQSQSKHGYSIVTDLLCFFRKAITPLISARNGHPLCPNSAYIKTSSFIMSATVTVHTVMAAHFRNFLCYSHALYKGKIRFEKFYNFNTFCI